MRQRIKIIALVGSTVPGEIMQRVTWCLILYQEVTEIMMGKMQPVEILKTPKRYTK